MLFSKLCSYFERISAGAQKIDKIRILEELWVLLRHADGTGSDEALASNAAESCQQEYKAEQATAPQNTAAAHHPQCLSIGERYYMYMRLLMPQLDTQRATYGLKESKIAKFYVELLGLPATSADALRFMHWKDPSKNSIETTSFSDVVYVVLGKRGYNACATAASSGLTVLDINRQLDTLAAAATTEEKKAVLMQLLRRCTAVEHKWLVRIITKELKMHIHHPSILAAFHPSAVEMYNNTNDLAYVCRKCTEPSEMLVAGDIKSGIFLFQPFKPMLASVANSAKLAALLEVEQLIVEPKYDGERMMLHISNTSSDTSSAKIQYWTRNAKNYTALYGPKFDHVIREAVLNKHASTAVSNLILDGEFLLYDSDTKEFKEFGQNRTYAVQGTAAGGGLKMLGDGMARSQAEQRSDEGSSAIDESKLWFCYQVFDIIFLNGESLLATPLERRKQILRQVVVEQPNKFAVTSFTPVSTMADILKQLDAALTAKHEGILIKVATSHYIPGERRTKWIKLKPDHVSGLADTLDLVVLGGYYGTKYGLRHVSHFLLGVWKNDSSPTPASPEAQFVTVCKVGTGYSEAELREIQAQLSPHWVPLPHGSVPDWLGGWKPGAGEVPDVYIEPKHSIVLEIFGYSFTATSKFSFGQTLRFPRCHRVRIDKTVADATDLLQLLQMVRSSRSQFSSKIAALASGGGALVTVQAEKRARKLDLAARVKQEQQQSAIRSMAFVSPTISVPQRGSVDRASDFLAGYEVCVLFAAPDQCQRHDIERELLSHGAVVVANPQPRTSIIVSTSASAPRVAHWIQQCQKEPLKMKEKYFTTSIIRLDWLRQCIKAATVLPLAPRHMIYTSPDMQAIFQRTLDPFGDSFYDAATVDSLKDSVQAAARGIRIAAAGASVELDAQSTASCDVESILQAGLRIRRLQQAVLEELNDSAPGAPDVDSAVAVLEHALSSVHACIRGSYQELNQGHQDCTINAEENAHSIGSAAQLSFMFDNSESERQKKRLRDDEPCAAPTDAAAALRLLQKRCVTFADASERLTNAQALACMTILGSGRGSVWLAEHSGQKHPVVDFWVDENGQVGRFASD